MIQEIGNIDLPATLYKYCDWSIKFHKKILTKREVFFASPAMFNDPFDCKIPVRYDINPEKQLKDFYFNVIKARYKDRSDKEIREFSKRYVHEGEVDPKSFKKNDSKYFEKLNERMGVLSLSSQNNDILMWGHYANSHKGFCVGFDTSELLKTQNVDFIGKVDYCPDFPIIIPNGETEYQFEKQIFSKWDKWKYEDEYRLTKNHIKNRTIEIHESAYKELILGFQMPKKERKQLKTIVKKKFPHMTIFEAKPHDEKFLIEITNIK
jgi:hypothetical protein